MDITNLYIFAFLVFVVLITYLYYLNRVNVKSIKELFEAKIKGINSTLRQMREANEAELLRATSDTYGEALKQFSRSIFLARIAGGLIGNVRVSSDIILDLFYKRAVSGVYLTIGEHRYIRDTIFGFSSEAVMEILYHVYHITDKHASTHIPYRPFDSKDSSLPKSVVYRTTNEQDHCWIFFDSVLTNLLDDLAEEFEKEPMFTFEATVNIQRESHKSNHLHVEAKGSTTKPE